jgi:hypothetical protein
VSASLSSSTYQHVLTNGLDVDLDVGDVDEGWGGLL